MFVASASVASAKNGKHRRGVDGCGSSTRSPQSTSTKSSGVSREGRIITPPAASPPPPPPLPLPPVVPSVPSPPSGCTTVLSRCWWRSS
ncbi:unnamed protein product [Ectocarpus sp. CCAP 1310/34]|nr:unnamed protein product [Ectocarpus sp. CCAP 1310/34]